MHGKLQCKAIGIKGRADYAMRMHMQGHFAAVLVLGSQIVSALACLRAICLGLEI